MTYSTCMSSSLPVPPARSKCSVGGRQVVKEKKNIYMQKSLSWARLHKARLDYNTVFTSYLLLIFLLSIQELNCRDWCHAPCFRAPKMTVIFPRAGIDGEGKHWHRGSRFVNLVPVLDNIHLQILYCVMHSKLSISLDIFSHALINTVMFANKK